MKYLVFLILGYLLGSISPAYFLGKILRGIDIRNFGDGNAGTINAYKILGLWPAVLTAIFDLSKGLLAMYLCWQAGGSPFVIHLAGLAAVLGHIFPFYLGFQGGQGVATATAIMIYYLTIFYLKSWLPLNSLPFLAFAVAVFSWITRKGEFVGLVILPLISLLTALFLPAPQYLIFFLSLVIYILFVNILNLFRQKAFDFSTFQGKDIISWRIYLRPLAFILVIFYIYTDRSKTLTAVGTVALFFLLLDLTRLISARVNLLFLSKIKGIYKSKEHRKFSSITIFLLSLFLIILIFEKKIAIFSAAFLTFGDFFSKYFGLKFGRHKTFNKTLEGSLAHFTACLLSGFILNHYLSLSFYIYLTGAAAATIFELLPLGIDDNFSVSLLSASVMTLYKVF